MTENPDDSPPSPPEFQRKLAFYPYQLVGLLLILAVPTLAVLGVFGESFAEVSASSSDLAMQVTYTTRHRYQMAADLEVAVQNLSDQPLSTLTIRIDNHYLQRFSNIQFTPSVTHITATHHEVELTDIAPSESRMVIIELEAEHYGEHEGVISASADEAEPVELNISTLILP